MRNFYFTPPIYCTIIFYYLFSFLSATEALSCTPYEKLLAPNVQQNAFFGQSVSSIFVESNSKQLIAVGAFKENSEFGAAYIYSRKDYTTKKQRDESTTKLESPSPASGGHYGWAIQMNQNFIVVGAPGENSVYIYSTDDLKFIRQITGSLEFGYSIAITADLLLIGARASNTAVLYKYSNNNWQLLSTFQPAIGNIEFGYAVAMTENVIVIGAPSNNSIYVYERNQGGENNWGEKIKISDPLAQTTTDILNFGAAISILPTQDTIFVGAYQEPSAGKASGAAYIFKKYSDDWLQVQRLVGPNARPFDHYGEAFSAVSSDLILIAAHKRQNTHIDAGVVYVYSRNHSLPYPPPPIPQNKYWYNSDTLASPTPSPFAWFGWSISVSKSSHQYTIVIGASQESTNMNNGGAAYVFNCPFAELKEDDDVSIPSGVLVGIFISIGLIAIATTSIALYCIWKRRKAFGMKLSDEDNI